MEEEKAPAPASPVRRLFHRPGGKASGGKKNRKKLIVIAAVLVVAAGGTAALLQSRTSGKQDNSAEYTETAAERRDVTQSLTSSGTLQPADSYTVTTLVSGEILSDTFEKGDQVEKGQLLYKLDASDASSSLTQTENGVTQAQNSLSQAQKNYRQTVENQYPTADLSGTVEAVYVQNGDTVTAGTQLVQIVGDKNLYIDFLFSYASPSDFYVGQPATIFVTGFADSISGTVTAVSSSTATTGRTENSSGNQTTNGRQVVSVRVKAANPGLVTAGYTASAVIGSYTSYGESTVSVGASSVVTAAVSGKVENLKLLVGDTISKGDRICAITGDSVDNQVDSAKDQVTNAQLSLNNAQSSLSSAQERLDDYTVTAPISGTVVTKTAKAGDKIEGGSDGTLCTIYDLSYLTMTMSIDELDISEVAVGQSVEITADAVPDKTYTGTVTEVSVAGTTSGGITTYPVTVRIDETDGLLPGMNVDAKIVIENRENVLAIPSAAVSRGNLVLVTKDSPSAAGAAEQEAPEGYVYVQVETGVDDGTYVEITSGLQEGDTVAYTAAASSSNDMSIPMGGQMPDGMSGSPGGGPGGAPGGGPSGGGPGGGF